MDLIWGFAGILSLGHGLFFALGGYAFGMYLMRQIGRDGSYGATCPTSWCSSTGRSCRGSGRAATSLVWAMLLVLLVPALLALVFGYFAFRSRIKGVYFSIITQALTYAAMLLFFRNETGFGGNNGFTDFKRILGYSITSPGTRRVCSRVGAGAAAGLPARRYLVRSKFGRVLRRSATPSRGSCSSATTRSGTSSSAWVLSACCAASPARSTCRRSASSTRAR
jgi:urea transport system permease protein